MNIDGNVNGYTPADAYQLLKSLLARDAHKKERGAGFLTGAELAVIGGCMTILRVRDRQLADAEHKATVLP